MNPPAHLARPLSLRANFSWTFAGNVVYAASQWAMLVVLAKLGTPEMVGQFSLGLAVTAPIMLFANLQLRAVQATDARREYRFGDYLGLRLITTLLALLAIAAVAALSGYAAATVAVILMIGLAKAFESISDIFYGLMQQRERMDRIARSMMIKGALSLALLGLGVWLTGSVLWGAAGLAAAWAALLLTYDLRSARLILPASPDEPALRPRRDAPTLRRLAWLALPLGITMMLISLNTNIPRYVMEGAWGERTLGLYAAMAYLIVAGTTVVSALGQSASPRLAQYYAAGNLPAFRRLLLRLVGIGAALGLAGVIVAAVAGKEILTLIYTPEYAENADVFVWIVVAAGIAFVASFLGYGMTAARYFKAQAPLFLFVVAVTTLASLWLIPSNGMYGAVAALMASNAVQLLGSLVIVLWAIYHHPGEKPT